MGAACSSKGTKNHQKEERSFLEEEEEDSLQRKLRVQRRIDGNKLMRVPALSKRFMNDSTLMRKRKTSLHKKDSSVPTMATMLSTNNLDEKQAGLGSHMRPTSIENLP